MIKNFKMLKALNLFLIIFFLISLLPINFVKGENTGKIIIKKSKTIEISYDTEGFVESKKIVVTLKIDNKDIRNRIIDLIDRVENILPNTLTMLGGTPQPSTIENFGNTTIITWKNLKILSEETLTYEYSAETKEDIPLGIEKKIYVNGKEAEKVYVKGTQYIKANVSDNISWSIKLKRKIDRILSGKTYVLEPLLVTVTLSLDEKTFSSIRTNPEANTTMSLAGTNRISWLILLRENEVILNLTAKVASVGTFGVVSVDSMLIQISENQELVLKQIDSNIKSLEVSREAYDKIYLSSIKVRSSLEEVSKALNSLNSGLSTIVDKSSTISYGLEKSIDSLKMLSNASNKLIDEGLEGVFSGVNATKYAMENIEEALNVTKLINENILNGLDAMASGYPSIISALEVIRSNLNATILALNGLNQGITLAINYENAAITILQPLLSHSDPNVQNTVKNALSNLTLSQSILQQVKNNMTMIITGLEMIVNNMGQLIDGMKQASSGINAIRDGLKTSNSIIEKTLDGLKILSNSTEYLLEGFREIVDAQKDLINKTFIVINYMDELNLGLEKSLEATNEISKNLNKLDYSFNLIINGLKISEEELGKNINRMNENIVNLKEIKNALSYYSKKINYSGVEIRLIDSKIDIAVAPSIKHSSNIWTIDGIYIDSIARASPNSTIFIYWASLKFNKGTTIESIKMLYNDEWINVGNFTSLKIFYNISSNTLYLPIYKEVEVNKKVNILNSITGNQLKIIIRSENDPEVRCKIDAAFYPKEVSIEKMDSTIKTYIDLPHIFSLSKVLIGEAPIEEEIEKPMIYFDIYTLIIIILILIISTLIIRMRRKKEERKLEEIDTSRILEKIDMLEKMIEEKTKES
ncbi:MAG: hypothetical protein QXP60_09555 [Nitrososphaerota archaeon]